MQLWGDSLQFLLFRHRTHAVCPERRATVLYPRLCLAFSHFRNVMSTRSIANQLPFKPKTPNQTSRRAWPLNNSQTSEMRCFSAQQITSKQQLYVKNNKSKHEQDVLICLQMKKKQNKTVQIKNEALTSEASKVPKKDLLHDPRKDSDSTVKNQTYIWNKIRYIIKLAVVRAVWLCNEESLPRKWITRKFHVMAPGTRA